MIDFDGLGLGLEYGLMRLRPVDERWPAIGGEMAADLTTTLEGLVASVVHIGSTCVPALLAKPILDFAAGIRADDGPEPVIERLVEDGWIHRGDAGDEGGHVLVLEVRPMVRVAHMHVVEHRGRQWRRYLALRELLTTDASARDRYGAAKAGLAARLDGVDGRRRYTAAKGPVIESLLAEGSSRARNAT